MAGTAHALNPTERMIAEHGTLNPGVEGSRHHLFFYGFPFHVFWWGVDLSGVIYEETHRLPVEYLFSFFVVSLNLEWLTGIIL